VLVFFVVCSTPSREMLTFPNPFLPFTLFPSFHFLILSSSPSHLLAPPNPEFSDVDNDAQSAYRGGGGSLVGGHGGGSYYGGLGGQGSTGSRGGAYPPSSAGGSGRYGGGGGGPGGARY
jgi:hypothetical protein